MLAAAALGALGAQLEQLQAAKQDWFVGASLVDEQDISLEADGAVTVRRQAFDKALRNFPKTDSPSKAKAARKMEVTDYDQVIAGERFCSRSERQALASAAATTWWSSTSVSRVRRVTGGCCACRACLGFEYDCGCPLWRCNAMDQAPCVIGGQSVHAGAAQVMKSTFVPSAHHLAKAEKDALSATTSSVHNKAGRTCSRHRISLQACRSYRCPIRGSGTSRPHRCCRLCSRPWAK